MPTISVSIHVKAFFSSIHMAAATRIASMANPIKSNMDHAMTLFLYQMQHGNVVCLSLYLYLFISVCQSVSQSVYLYVYLIFSYSNLPSFLRRFSTLIVFSIFPFSLT